MTRTEIALAILLLALVPISTLSSESSASTSCPFSSSGDQGRHVHDDGHGHGHSHRHHDHDGGHVHSHHDHDGGHVHSHHDHDQSPADDGHSHSYKLAEELAEEEELRLYGFKSQSHWEEKYQHEHVLSPLGLWLRALGCSLLVSMASLICLIILPLIVAQGKPSRIVVDFLAAFGAGAMLGDAFLHQLPHALEHGHTHANHNHSPHSIGQGHTETGGHGHAHSIQDLSVGLAVLAGIILFFIVEKIVRQAEKSSSKGTLPWAHHHHHHHHHHGHDKKHLEEDGEETEGNIQEILPKDTTSGEDSLEKNTNGFLEQERANTNEPHRRKKKAGTQDDSIKETTPLLSEKDDSEKKSASVSVEQIAAPNLILGYLNLFSDGVHNFTDGMALGSAFLNHGTIGGWSRTLFLLAHEIPQEVGDFGILVQSGFSVLKALAFNFLSALMALAGTALALLLGGSPEHSSLIEGFTAGGFIYIAVAGVLPEMHQYGTSAKTTLLQLVALGSGMSVALLISLVE